MRDFQNVKILRGVSHVVAPRDPKLLLVLSEAELPLGGGVGDILSAHVEGGLRDPQAKAAIFTVRGDERTFGTCAKLLGARPHLVELSQQLATSLYAIAERDDRVSDGTLAVLLCEATQADGELVRFPAVLKLDPSATLHMVRDNEPRTGKKRVRYAVDPNSLPSKNEKIQKCAFIRTLDPEAAFELLVVDRQRPAETVSRFWLTDFLGAELVLDAPERTKRLYRSLLAARNEVARDVGSTELARLDQAIDGVVVMGSVNVDEFVASLPLPLPIREHIGTVVARTLPDREFDLDSGVASQFVRRRRYQADNNLRLTVGAEFVDMIHVDDLEPGDGNIRRRRVWFETQTWKET
jgi:hypothetical protein